MSQQKNIHVILNTIAASAGDVSVSDGFVNIAGCPSVKYLDITSSAGIVPSQFEQPTIVKVTPGTLAANSVYQFALGQLTSNSPVYVQNIIRYSAGASAPTAAQIIDGWAAQINQSNFNATASNISNTYLKIEADAGYPLFDASSINGGLATVADLEVTDLSNGGTYAVSGISNATPRVITLGAGHGLVNGQNIKITGITASGGFADIEGRSLKLQIINATTAYLLDTSATGAITLGSSFLAYLPGQVAMGQTADVTADLVANGVSTAPTANYAYAHIDVNYGELQSDASAIVRKASQFLRVWFIEGLVNATTAPLANWLTLKARLEQILAGVSAEKSVVATIVATSTSTTTDFASLQVGDQVVGIPVPAGTPANTTGTYFGTVAAAGTLPFAAVVGNIYLVLRAKQVDYNLIAVQS
jgi:hypothetical protein